MEEVKRGSGIPATMSRRTCELVEEMVQRWPMVDGGGATPPRFKRTRGLGWRAGEGARSWGASAPGGLWRSAAAQRLLTSNALEG